jgi:undecaprenyl-phosphate 4-deoxy-4-formamido-L-arabinose transferase
VLIVEDGGRDGTWNVIVELAARDPRVRGIRHSRNFGQHNALLSGIREARGSVVVTLDDDLQNPPEEIPLLLARLEDGFDVVYGTPAREQHGLFRDLASRITKLVMQSAMGAQTARQVSAFRAFRTHLRDAFARYTNPYVSIDVLLTWGTTAFSSVVVRHAPRTEGESNYTLGKLVRHAFNMITGFSLVPLQLASLMGFFFTLFGMGLLVYVLLTYLIHGSKVAGFPFLASIISIFSGAQMFALGIIGEYLARIHLTSMGRPVAVVGERTREPAPNA